ncbi:AAA family ATPase [Trichlorobacter lovleyi]|uniref:AAA family ATPase n=1 Tax=Trichlorobacter lovleyi TaxID=313985 RepID=UPI003D0F2309
MPSVTHKIEIANCNNITAGSVSICEGQLNIKYAINGTGKSTIAQAIQLSSAGKPLTPLTPFSIIASKQKGVVPTVAPMPFHHVMVFDTSYLKQYVYQKNDLLKDTFEILIRTEEYNDLKAAIDRDFDGIKALARDKASVTELKRVMDELCKLIAVTGQKKLDQRKPGAKSLMEGKGALFQPPEALSEFRPFFGDDIGSSWAEWKFKGIQAFGDKGLCPFCAEPETEQKKKQTQVFQASFDEASVSYASQLRDYLKSISVYIDSRKMDYLLSLFKHDANRSDLEMALIKIRAEADYLAQRINALLRFDGYAIDQSNMDAFSQQFETMKISVDGFDYFTTDAFLEIVKPINDQISQLIGMIGKLKGEVAKFSIFLEKQVTSRKDDINAFLASAGFTYTFDVIVSGDGNAHAVLQYRLSEDATHEVKDPDIHLSWGERNAFALILFMFDAISKNADLVVLDDPISSFDSNKKYAIINRLFKTGRGAQSLYQKAVLMLTHDFEPIIDYIQVGGKLSGDSVNAAYLQNAAGTLTERVITKNSDMLSMVVLLKEIAEDENVSLPVRVGCLRKYIEHTVRNPHDGSLAYHILSSVTHGRPWPTFDAEGQCPLSQEENDRGKNEIHEHITDFDYPSALLEFSSASLLTLFKREQNAFYKLLILRAYTESNGDARERLKAKDDVLRKYIDETYHIENDYLYSLDVRVYNIVPEHYQRLAENYADNEITQLDEI